MTKTLIILGTSGLAHEVLLIATRVNEIDHRWDEFGFVGPDPDPAPAGARYLGTDDELLASDAACDVVAGIGDPQVRDRALHPYLEREGRFEFPNLIHPLALLDQAAGRVSFGRGNVVFAGASFTCDIRVGDFNCFNPNATVGHDAVVGSATVVNPGANISGWVRVGDRVLVGTGAQILAHVLVGDDAVVGAGALVRGDVAAGDTVVGVPARPLPR